MFTLPVADKRGVIRCGPVEVGSAVFEKCPFMVNVPKGLVNAEINESV